MLKHFMSMRKRWKKYTSEKTKTVGGSSYGDLVVVRIEADLFKYFRFILVNSETEADVC